MTAGRGQVRRRRRRYPATTVAPPEKARPAPITQPPGPSVAAHPSPPRTPWDGVPVGAGVTGREVAGDRVTGREVTGAGVAAGVPGCRGAGVDDARPAPARKGLARRAVVGALVLVEPVRVAAVRVEDALRVLLEDEVPAVAVVLGVSGDGGRLRTRRSPAAGREHRCEGARGVSFRAADGPLDAMGDRRRRLAALGRSGVCANTADLPATGDGSHGRSGR